MSIAFVESIHGDIARVIMGEESVAVTIPLRHLPPGTGAGTVLQAKFSIDHAATNARAKGQKARGKSTDE